MDARAGIRHVPAPVPPHMKRNAPPRGLPALLAFAATLAALLGALAAGAGETDEGKAPRRPANLVPNGDFEKGKGPGPESWQRPDELTTFWVAAPGRKGKCMRIDTDVLASQFREREDQLAKAAREKEEPPPPAKKKPTAEPKYDTVAGLDGVHFVSSDIPLKHGSFYRLEVDVKVEGKASPKVWVKAYGTLTSKGGARERQLWKKSLNCEGASSEWRTFRMAFPLNTRIPPAADKLRISLYPYWPPATYYFDDVRLVEVSEDEARALAGGGAEADEK
ncbi:MAG: hypothetical protein HY721_25240 [Planctomycetes bacterium]|nr:hypothetical protein [Planctomycetota bacterium]